MTTIELRQASSVDASVVADLMLEAFPDKFDPILGDAAVPVFHALFDDLADSTSVLAFTSALCTRATSCDGRSHVTAITR